MDMPPMVNTEKLKMENNFASCNLPELLSAAKMEIRESIILVKKGKESEEARKANNGAKMEISKYLGLERGRKKNLKKDNGESEAMKISYEFREGQ